jgi:hypothetical protein
MHVSVVLDPSDMYYYLLHPRLTAIRSMAYNLIVLSAQGYVK